MFVGLTQMNEYDDKILTEFKGHSSKDKLWLKQKTVKKKKR